MNPKDYNDVMDRLFEMQLELEDAPPGHLREWATTVRARCDAHHASPVVYHGVIWLVLGALSRSLTLSSDQKTERFDAWCNGFGADANQIVSEFASAIRQLRDEA